jgi:uncharacterized protein (TIGR02117 family)
MEGWLPAWRTVAALACAGALAACAGADRPPAASAGDCVTVGVSQTAMHTDFYLPARAFEPGSPIRRLYPDARWFSIGWGDAQAYQHGTTVPTAIAAGLWPTPSVLHVTALDRDPRQAMNSEYADLGLSEEGMAALVARLDASFETDADGNPQPTMEGKIAGRSVFAASEERYHAFNTCNVWSARRLREAGASIAIPDLMLLPGWLRGQVRGAGSCEDLRAEVSPAAP